MSESEHFEIVPINDNPVNDATLLGHKEIVDTLKRFIESEHMISSSSVAIHGEWGSGKTSVMKTLENNLDKSTNEVLFFEAWKYENSNPAIALITHIGYKLKTVDADIVNSLVKSAVYALTDWFLGSRISDNLATIISNIQRTSGEIQNLSDKLQKSIKKLNKKLIIIIDDLDRCDVENTLQILSLMKLFLSVDNCVVIAAVDFKRLEQAWKMKYQIKDDANDARNYLDKIFQIRIAMPIPNRDGIIEYYKKITKDMPIELLTLFADLGPSNPRAIKRTLNLISYRTFLLDHESTKLYSSCIWTILEHSLSHQTLYYLSKELKGYQGSSFGLITQHSSWQRVENDFGFLSPINFEKIKNIIQIYWDNSHMLIPRLGITAKDLFDDFELLYEKTIEIERPQLDITREYLQES